MSLKIGAARVCIIVLNFNTRDILKTCLMSIPEALEDLSLNYKINEYEIIVVDNASSDGSQEMIRKEFPYVTLLSNPKNEGFSKAVNRAAALSSGEFLLISNSDIVYTKGSIAKMIYYCKCDQNIGILGPQLVYPDGRWQRSYGDVPSIRQAIKCVFFIYSVKNALRRLSWPKIKFDFKPRCVEYIDGAAMLVRKDIWDSLGGFDERFFFYAEDADLCFRARKKGAKVIFFPSAKIVHFRGASYSSFSTKNIVRMKLESDSKLVLKYWGKTCLMFYLALMEFYALERISLGNCLSHLSFMFFKGNMAKTNIQTFKALREESSTLRKQIRDRLLPGWPTN